MTGYVDKPANSLKVITRRTSDGIRKLYKKDKNSKKSLEESVDVNVINNLIVQNKKVIVIQRGKSFNCALKAYRILLVFMGEVGLEKVLIKILKY